MEGKELSGVYNGYTYMPFYLGHSNMSSFQHLWDFEPATRNHWVPNYGQFSQQYFYFNMKRNVASTANYAAMDKNAGPPYYYFGKTYEPLDKNEYLLSKGVDIEALKARNKGHSLVEAWDQLVSQTYT